MIFDCQAGFSNTCLSSVVGCVCRSPVKHEVRAPLVDRGGLPHSRMCHCIACQVVMLSTPMGCAGAVGGCTQLCSHF